MNPRPRCSSAYISIMNVSAATPNAVSMRPEGYWRPTELPLKPAGSGTSTAGWPVYPDRAMNEPKPIACSLDADDYATRLAAVRDIGEIALVRAEHHDDGAGADLFFRDGDEIRRRLQAVVEAEATCCAFLDIDLHAEPGVLRLSISGPADAVPVIRDLVESFGSGREASGPGTSSTTR